MLAIYEHQIYIVGDNLNECVLLDVQTSEERLRIDFGSPTLIVDPTKTATAGVRLTP